jgi:hypothetical protein
MNNTIEFEDIHDFKKYANSLQIKEEYKGPVAYALYRGSIGADSHRSKRRLLSSSEAKTIINSCIRALEGRT